MRIFIFLAFLGLVVSLAAHISTYLGVDPEQSLPYIWLLHIGIFVVWLPALAVQGTLPRGADGKFKPFAYAPKWMRWLTSAAFAYALINFAVFIFLVHTGSPSYEGGRYILQNHGKFVRQISEQEYHQYRAYEVRGFSGHWMLFYAAAMTMLASGIRYRNMSDEGSVPPAEDRQRRIGLWVHSAFAIILQMIGFFFGPAIFIGCLILTKTHFGCFSAVLWFLTPWPGLAFAHYLLKYKLPATCPKCGGRAFWTGTQAGQNYRCADCGWRMGAH